MNRMMMFSAALALGLGGCMTQGAAPPVMPVAVTASSASEFTMMATSSNLLEIESSRLALRNSRDADVRSFANRMIRDHGAAARKMTTAVRAAGLPAPARSLSARHQTMLDTLQSASPEEFDAAYLELQANAHTEGVTLFSSYAENGDNPRLQRFARETLPTLEMHAEHVERLRPAR